MHYLFTIALVIGLLVGLAFFLDAASVRSEHARHARTCPRSGCSRSTWSTIGIK
jgi:hypothetical protein